MMLVILPLLAPHSVTVPVFFMLSINRPFEFKFVKAKPGSVTPDSHFVTLKRHFS